MISPLIYAFYMSILPLGELRLGIIYAITNNINPLTAFLWCTFANIIAIPIIMFFFDKIHRSLLHIKIYNNLFNRLIKRIQHKVHRYVEKYGYIGLILFVSLPLPGSGAYSGVIGSWLLGMNQKKSLYAIALGVLVAGVIVTLGTVGIISVI